MPRSCHGTGGRPELPLVLPGGGVPAPLPPPTPTPIPMPIPIPPPPSPSGPHVSSDGGQYAPPDGPPSMPPPSPPPPPWQLGSKPGSHGSSMFIPVGSTKLTGLFVT